MFFGNQADKLKGKIMAKVKEVWVRFSDTETYYEKEGELLSIFANASGDCVVKVYIENIRSCKELCDWSFDKEQLPLLTDVFGEENVRYQEREIKTEIKWSRPTEVPKIKQLLPCRHDILGISPLDEAVYDVCGYELEGGEIWPEAGKPDEQR